MRKGEVHFNGPKREFVNQGDRSYLIHCQTEKGMETHNAGNLDQLQIQIDKIRGQGQRILSIEREKVGLDKAFKRFQSQENNR